MKKILNITLALAMALAFVGCEDFLTIYPSNQIVEEDFWQDKNDLQNVVASCYTKMCDMMSNYVQWGECRSDNVCITIGKNWEHMENIMNANLLPTYSEFSWSSPYNVINCCNKILAHGPEVVQRDKSFAPGDWDVIRSEVIAIRALMHFYLTRVWCDVPYVTEDYNNDGQNFLIAQTKQEDVLNNIIADLDSVKNKSMDSFNNTVWDRGRITRIAVYSILADAYLWRASLNASPDSVAKKGAQISQEDYKKCIICCDSVISFKKKELYYDLNNKRRIAGGVQLEDIEDKDLLIPDERNSNDKLAMFEGAHDNIFGQGNSKEGIFELQIDGTNHSNGMSTSYYFNLSDKAAANLCGTEVLFHDAATNSDDHVGGTPLFSKKDYRRWASIYKDSKPEQTIYPIVKFSARTISQQNSGSLTDNSSNGFKYNAEIRTSSTNSANWIFYRITDIMLMKAEAMSQLETTVKGSDEIKHIFDIVTTVFKRSNPNAYSKDGTKEQEGALRWKKFENSGAEEMEKLVLEERQREFIGEGKRWFDLVRFALRRGNTNEMLKLLGRKYSANKGAIEAKLATIYSLYSPINQTEIDNNKLLVQNPVWKNNENSKKTDEQ